MTNTLNENGHWVQDNKLDNTSTNLDRDMDLNNSSNTNQQAPNGTNLDRDSLDADNLLNAPIESMHELNITPNRPSTSKHHNCLGSTSPQVMIHIGEAIDNVVKNFTIKIDLTNESSSNRSITKQQPTNNSKQTKSLKKQKVKNRSKFTFNDDFPFELNSSSANKKNRNQDKRKENSIGPFIRVEKRKHQINYTVVNNSSRLEDKDNKFNNKPNYGTIAKKSSNQILFKPNDSTWICIFCKRQSHFKQLGDLFGPHELICDKNLDNSTNNLINNNSFNTQPSTSSYSSNHNNNNSWSFNNSAAATTTSRNEIWFHEDCIIWSNGIYLAGNRVRNIDEIVLECSEIVSTIVFMN